MGRSSLLGTDPAAAEPAGRDTAVLGPSDSSDSGSDMMGIADGDGADVNMPTDEAMRDDTPHPLVTPEIMGGSGSDAAGTGERRSAGSDAGVREASDIGVDRVFTPGVDDTLSDDDDNAADESDDEADITAIDDAEAGDPLEDEDEPADSGA